MRSRSASVQRQEMSSTEGPSNDRVEPPIVHDQSSHSQRVRCERIQDRLWVFHMETLKFIQLGDIHLPDVKSLTNTDSKDDGFPTSLANIIGLNPLQAVMREVVHFCEKERHSIAAILICGDLTSRGDLAGYQECLNYLQSNLRLATSTVWQPERIHAVPGNHDIDRTKCDPAHTDLFIKFEALSSAWANLGLPILPVKGVRRTHVELKGQTAEVFSLNSCLGCGEQLALPKKIKSQLHALLQPFLTSPDAFDLIGHQLDTPAFDKEHLHALLSAIADLPATSVPIVLAHHNLLPQAVPRIEIYTEVINGGMMRSRLAQCSHPVIYSHGHIHEDPVEVVSFPKTTEGRLVSVSAPNLVQRIQRY